MLPIKRCCILSALVITGPLASCRSTQPTKSNSDEIHDQAATGPAESKTFGVVNGTPATYPGIGYLKLRDDKISYGTAIEIRPRCILTSGHNTALYTSIYGQFRSVSMAVQPKEIEIIRNRAMPYNVATNTTWAAGFDLRVAWLSDLDTLGSTAAFQPLKLSLPPAIPEFKSLKVPFYGFGPVSDYDAKLVFRELTKGYLFLSAAVAEPNTLPGSTLVGQYLVLAPAPLEDANLLKYQMTQGDSGGPVMNSENSVIGINSSGYSSAKVYATSFGEGNMKWITDTADDICRPKVSVQAVSQGSGQISIKNASGTVKLNCDTSTPQNCFVGNSPEAVTLTAAAKGLNSRFLGWTGGYTCPCSGPAPACTVPATWLNYRAHNGEQELATCIAMFSR